MLDHANHFITVKLYFNINKQNPQHEKTQRSM